MGRKMGAVDALAFLQEKNVLITAIVCPSPRADGEALRAFARKNKIPFFVDDAKLYALIKKNRFSADLVISYLYPKKIRTPLITFGARGCINFHPAPLPENKGRAGYNTAILDGEKTFGVSAHFVDSEKLDAGPIIKVLRFPINPQTETAFSLEKRTQEKLLVLFKDVIEKFLSGKDIVTRPNAGGRYLTANDLEAMKRVRLNETPEDIRRKIRAFFFPPYTGATLRIGGETFTLIDQSILDTLAELLEKH